LDCRTPNQDGGHDRQRKPADPQAEAERPRAVAELADVLASLDRDALEGVVGRHDGYWPTVDGGLPSVGVDLADDQQTGRGRLDLDRE